MQDATVKRGSTQRGANAATSWELWTSFCASLGLDASRLPTEDPVPLLQLFAQRYRTGVLAPGRRSVRARAVEDAVRPVGQAYARMGTPDPRLDRHGQLDFRLSSLYRSWQNTDDPPSRVKPLPLTLVAQVCRLATMEHTATSCAAADCLIMGFFFLLRPGEYLGTWAMFASGLAPELSITSRAPLPTS